MSLDIAVARLVNQVGHWTPARWSKPVSTGDGSRADAVHALVQQLADAAALAEGQPRRRVPRLDNDMALTDQLRVVAADLIGAAGTRADLLDEAAASVRATAGRL